MSGVSMLAAMAAIQAAAPASQPALSPELAPLAPLVGHCWRATFPGTSQTDTHCYSMMTGGRQVRDRHVVAGAAGPYSGETIFRWDPEMRRIRYDYYASDGGYSSGTVEATTDGLSYPEENYVSPTGQRLRLRNGLTWELPEAFTGFSAMQRRAAWHEMWRMRFMRISAAPTEPALDQSHAVRDRGCC